MAKLTCVRPVLGRLAPALKAPPKLVDVLYRDPRWLALMRGIKRARGDRCQDCGAKASDGAVIHGDHIHEVKDGGAPFDARNIRLRCTGCHNRKTAEVRRMRCEGGGGSESFGSPAALTAFPS